MADYQCPTCFETMEKPKYAPVALKCGHVMCSTCLPRTIRRGQTNHVCGFCREECAPQDVYRIYLPPTVHSSSSTSASSSSRGSSSSLSLSDVQLKQAHTIAEAATRAGVESPTPELEKIVTSAERWYMSAEQSSEQSHDVLDKLLLAVTELRRKLVYAARLDSAKQLHLELRMKADTYKNEVESYKEGIREADLEVSQARREASHWQQLAKHAEAKASQWKKQAGVLEERRYTESVRAEGAVSILRSQIGVLQKEVLEQTQRKLKYKKRYYAAKKSTPRVQTRRYAPSDDDSLEIMSPTSTAEEAEISTAFSVPLLSSTGPLDALSARHSPENIPEVDLYSDDDGSQTVIYGPPSQPLSRAYSQTKKRKLSNASVSSDSSSASAPIPLEPEEQSAREAALDSRFSKRLRVARDEGVKEGWVPPDWKARVVMADRIKEMKGKRKRVEEDAEKTGEGANPSSSAGKTAVSAGSSKSGARKLQPRKA